MGFRMLQGRNQAVMEATSIDALRTELVGFANSLGFGRAGALAIVDHSLTQTQFHAIDNVPSEYDESFRDERLSKIDPVMQHCKHSSVPILWNQDTYVDIGTGNIWEQQAQFGYYSGVCFALHFPGGYHFCFGIESDRSLPSKSSTLNHIVSKLQMFALHAQEATFKLFLNTGEAANSFNLTPRELEALRWTMDGKTAWEVAEALNIAERTAVFHLRNAVQKLGCSSKHQAVLKALRLGLFSI